MNTARSLSQKVETKQECDRSFYRRYADPQQAEGDGNKKDGNPFFYCILEPWGLIFCDIVILNASRNYPIYPSFHSSHPIMAEVYQFISRFSAKTTQLRLFQRKIEKAAPIETLLIC